MNHMLDSALRKSQGLLGAAQAFAVGLDELGDIDLPSSLHGPIDQAQMRAIASLYLASELETAGVVLVVEQLSGLARGGGGLLIDLGGAAPLINEFWRNRHDRATAEERAQTFARLFGGDFDVRMLDLCEALYKLDELATNANYGGIAQQTRVRSAATRMVEATIDGGGGITVFVAQEIIGLLKAALGILGHPDLRGAFGARDLWGTITGIDRMSRTRRPDPRLFVRLGRAGTTVLAWLADAAPHLKNSAALLVALDHPVIPAAVDWMEAALTIGETGGAPSQIGVAVSIVPASPWAALAG